jgi:O-Antigen ligase
VGEIALLSGMVVLFRTGAFVGALATLPAVMLVVLMAWVLARTVPFVSMYGFDALRDSTIVMYGGFAFIVIGLLLEDARRIDTVLRYYNILLVSLPAMFVGFYLTHYWEEYLPSLTGPVAIVQLTTSAVGTHLAGTMVFVLIGYRKVFFSWLLVWLATFTMVAATNRAATLAVLVPVMFAVLVLGRLRLLLTTILAAVSIFAVLLTVESSFTQDNETEPSTRRQVSAHQIVENATSIVGHSGQENVEGTKQWRLNWWNIIINDTLYGSSFWTGRGFGINLAEADGFVTGDPTHMARLRSPHNAHMTLMARAGIPGVTLWALVLVSWFGMMMRAMLTARWRRHEQWAQLFLFVVCYATSILINATFDVTLEGPMQGIWFWCLFGFGVGSVMVYRAQHSNGIGTAVR